MRDLKRVKWATSNILGPTIRTVASDEEIKLLGGTTWAAYLLLWREGNSFNNL